MDRLNQLPKLVSRLNWYCSWGLEPLIIHAHDCVACYKSIPGEAGAGV